MPRRSDVSPLETPAGLVLLGLGILTAVPLLVAYAAWRLGLGGES